MSDLKERLRDLDRLEAPDLWLTIVDRAQAAGRDAAPAASGFGIGRAGVLTAAAATLLLALATGLFASPFGAPTSALAVIERARAEFGEVPPFRAEIITRLDAEVIAAERPGYRGPDAVVRRVVSYVGADQWRRDIVENPVGVLDPAAGSYVVWDGETLGVYHADEQWFQTEPSSLGWDPLGWLSWDRADRYWHDACADGDVLADDVAGRSASHLDCGEFEVWIDAETGLILKHVTRESSEEILQVAYDVDFDPATFEVTPPPGASLDAPEPQTRLVVGAPAPGWTLMLVGGGELSLEQLAGTTSMVLIWSDWCDRACTDALRHLEHFAAGRSDWRAVSVVIDSGSIAIERIVQEHEITLDVALDDGTVVTEWGVNTVPTLVLLDEHGRVTAVHAGLEIDRELEKLAGDR